MNELDELYDLLSIIEEDELIAISCNPRISLLDYIKKVKQNVQDKIEILETKNMQS